MCMIGDAAGAIMQREAKSVLVMAPARSLGPIRWNGCAAGGSQSGRRGALADGSQSLKVRKSLHVHVRVLTGDHEN